MSPEDYESAKKSRSPTWLNCRTLTHHFIELFDLWSKPGCEKAFEYLTASCDRIGEDLEHLRGWAESMDETRRQLAQLLQSTPLRPSSSTGSHPTVSSIGKGLASLPACAKQRKR